MLIIYFPISSATDSLKTVVAPSGLKLRALPGIEGEVLAVLPHLAKVQVVTGENYLSVEDEVNYFGGEWIYVQYEDLEGYVFDGLLSVLPMPIERFEKTQFYLDLIYPLEAWMDFHQETGMEVDTFTSDLYAKLVYRYENGVRMEKKSTDLSYSLKVYLPKVKLSDVYYLLYNMLGTDEEIKAYTSNSLFIKDKTGRVNQIKVNLEDKIILKEKNEGIELSITTIGSGCVF
jgi:hypothetical protein